MSSWVAPNFSGELCPLFASTVHCSPAQGCLLTPPIHPVPVIPPGLTAWCTNFTSGSNSVSQFVKVTVFLCVGLQNEGGALKPRAYSWRTNPLSWNSFLWGRKKIVLKSWTLTKTGKENNRKSNILVLGQEVKSHWFSRFNLSCMG